MKDIKNLLAKLRNEQIKVVLKDDNNLDIISYAGKLSAKQIQEIKSNKEELINYLKYVKDEGLLKVSPVPVVATDSAYPLSYPQRRLWFASQMDEASSTYNMPSDMVLDGTYNIDCFQRAIHATIERHEILRTTFELNAEADVMQYVLSPQELEFSIDFKDFRDREVPESYARSYISKDSKGGFDLTKGPLFRAALLQLSDEKYVFYYNIHHIICDEWSMHVLSRDIMNYYGFFKDASISAPEPLRIHYKDYTSWQLKQLATVKFEAHRAYWLSRLSGELPQMNLPSYKPRPKVRTNNGQRLSTYLHKDLIVKMKNFVNKHEGSLFMLIMTVFDMLLYNYTGSSDIIVTSPVAGRFHHELENQVGLYANHLVLRQRINPEENFLKFYKRVKRNILNDFEHQEYPFDRLLEDLRLDYDASRTRLFDISLTLHEDSIGENSSKNHLTNKIDDQGSVSSRNDIEVHFTPSNDHLHFAINFNVDVYDQTMVSDMMIHFGRLLTNVLASEEQAIGTVAFLSDSEIDTLKNVFCSSPLTYPEHKTVVDLFVLQAQKEPNSIALIFKEMQLTYRELDDRSSFLAKRLIEDYGVKKGDFIGVLLDSNHFYIISILAILKTGAAYVPIDIASPESRKQHIVADAEIHLMITDTTYMFEIDFYEEVLLAVDVELDTFDKSSVLHKQIEPSDVAYVMYTSGTSGIPKGSLIPHRGIVRLCYSFNLVEKDTRMLQLAPTSFDASTFEIWCSLLKGGSLVIYPHKEVQSELINSIIRNNGINTVWFTSGLLDQWVLSDICGMELQHIFTGGDIVSPTSIARLQNLLPKTSIVNGYGPTENTTFTSVYGIPTDFDEYTSIPIGRPIAGTDIFILNSSMSLCPIGVIGELYTSGKGLSLGYLKQPELTAEKFLSHPFKEDALLYKTGDFARWLPNGNLEFLGRKDTQVKIRGYRIELKEIETILNKLEFIGQSVVIAKEDAVGQKNLVGYLVVEEPLDRQVIRDFLKKELPEYMIPKVYVPLKEIPLTPNGKVDTTALPDSQGTDYNLKEYVSPSNEVEAQMVSAWEKLLGIDKVGVNDHFFDLGGDSIKAIRLIGHYQKIFNKKMTIQNIFENPVLGKQSALIGSLPKYFEPVPKAPIADCYPLSHGQRRLWVLSQFDNTSVAYNIPLSIKLKGDYDITYFEKAIKTVIDRHEILRTVFRMDTFGEIRQWIIPSEEFNFTLHYEDYRRVRDNGIAIKQYIDDDSYRPFDLENGPILRASMLHVLDNEYIFYYNMHHIISDGWSMDILAKELFRFYEVLSQGLTPKEPVLRIQYKDFASWQLSNTYDEGVRSDQSYWLDKLAGELPLMNFAGKKLRPKLKTYQGESISTVISKEKTSTIRSFTKDNGGSMFMVMLSVWNALSYRYTAQRDIIVGVPIVERGHPDLENQIGFYLNTISLRNTVSPEDNFVSFYEKVKEATLEAYKHQNYPFDKLVDDLGIKREMSRSPIFDVLIDYHGESEASLDHNIQGIVFSGNSQVKYDLELHFYEVKDTIEIRLNYNSDIYERSLMGQLLTHFIAFMDTICQDLPIDRINFMSYEEIKSIGSCSQGRTVPLTYDNVIENFNARLEKNRAKSAINFNDKSLNYKELDQRSNQLAFGLINDYNIAQGDVVAIHFDTNHRTVISILGILKAGATYLFLDPSTPLERKLFILKDSMAKLLITETNYIFELNEFSGKLLSIDVEFDANWKNNKINYIDTSHAAYLIYTSGSTGIPKGVKVGHRALLNYLQWAKRFYSENGANKLNFGLFTTLSFDLTVTSLFLPILSGNTLTIIENSDVSQMLKDYFQSPINCIKLTPAHVKILPSLKIQADNVSVAIVGGDILNKDHVEILRTINPHMKIYNEYGPTETTVGCMVYEVAKNKIGSTIPIGKPIDNTKIYLFNESLEEQPINVEGEIYVSGSGLADEYYKRPDLNDEKFIVKGGQRLYRTGDMGKWVESGDMIFCGRTDEQIKIRGYRVEIDEITALMLKKPSIKGVVIIPQKTVDGDQYLIAYIVSEKEENLSELRLYLASKLPSYMIPSQFVQLDRIPLNNNGKVDKNKLRSNSVSAVPSGQIYLPPQDDVEIKLVAIWKKILNQEKVGMNDDFFILGGNSLLAIKLINAYQNEFDANLTLITVFNDSLIRDHKNLVLTEMNLKKEHIETLEF